MTTVENGATVSIHYVGTFEDGTEFDSSHSRNQPLQFQVGSGQMISGFDAALPGMEIGEKKNITLAPDEAYGPHNPQAIQVFPKNVFPPEFINDCLPLILISSSVSKQSATNAGQTTPSFLTPDWASFLISISV